MDYNKDKEFDDFFSKGFEENGLFIKPDNKEWDSLAIRLDQHQEKKSKGSLSWLWLLLPLMFLLQAWSLYDNYQLKNMLAEYQSNKNNRTIGQTIITDTLYQKISHITYDTIYKTVIIQQQQYPLTFQNHQNLKPEILQASNKINPASFTTYDPMLGSTDNTDIKTTTEVTISFSGFENKKETTITQQLPNISGFQTSQTPAPVDSSKNKDDEFDIMVQTAHVFKNDSTENNMSSSLDSALININDKDVWQGREAKDTDFQLKKEKTLADFMGNQKKPSALQRWLKEIKENNDQNYWRFGISSGLFLPFAVGEIDITSPITAGIYGEWVIGKHLSVLPSLSYNQFYYEAESPFISRLGIPNPPPAFPGTTFSEAESLHNMFMPSLQIRYRFLPENRWSWYAGTGYAAGFHLTSDIEYEYLDSNLNEVNQFINGHKSSNKLFYLNTHIGGQYHILPNLTVHLDIPVYFDMISKNRGFHFFAPAVGIKFFPKK